MNSKLEEKKKVYVYRVLCAVAVLIPMLPAVGNLAMLPIQLGTAAAALLFFGRIFTGVNRRLPVFFGLLLYMTCPYRIYICYGAADLQKAVVWMLLPLYVWAVMGLLTGKRGAKELVAAALALAGIGYAQAVFFVIVAGITFLAGLFRRRWLVFGSLLGGAVLFAPGLYRFLQYLFTDRFAELNVQPALIMQNGYRLGEFFTVYIWKDGHPGMGMGLFFCLLAGIWLKFVQGEAKVCPESRWFLVIAVAGTVMAWRYFPWDFVQRLGIWALRFVTLLETPAVFWGIACGALSVVGAECMGKISENENRVAAVAVPMAVLLFCVGGCIYQCSM